VTGCGLQQFSQARDEKGSGDAAPLIGRVAAFAFARGS
jgi:hypothetical protein